MILFLCYIFPPLAVLLMGRPFSATINVFLTMFLWFPGIQHALVHYADYRAGTRTREITKAINNPTWASSKKAKPVKREPIVNPFIGAKGTQFKRK